MYTAKSKKVALVVGHWKLDIVRLGILNNTVIYLSEHLIIIASQCPKKPLQVKPLRIKGSIKTVSILAVILLTLFQLLISGSVTSKVDSQTHSISGSLSQTQSSQWPWRGEFKSHTSKISLSLSDSIKKSCEKALDDELQSYQVWKKIPSVKLRGLDDNCMYTTL